MIQLLKGISGNLMGMIEHQTKATWSNNFDELFFNKIKGPFNNKKGRSQRCDRSAKIISQQKYLSEFKTKKEESDTKNKKAKTTTKQANQKPKQKKTITTNIKVIISRNESEHGFEEID